jgi:hypothetical protein
MKQFVLQMHLGFEGNNRWLLPYTLPGRAILAMYSAAAVVEQAYQHVTTTYGIPMWAAMAMGLAATVTAGVVLGYGEAEGRRRRVVATGSDVWAVFAGTSWT